MITNAQYSKHGTIIAVIGGVEMTVPDDMANRHRVMLAEWEAGGNAIEPYSPPTLNLPVYAAEKRWQTEVGGTIWNGWPVLTDRESQNKITAEALAIEKGERLDGDPWKFADGEFRPLTNAQMDSLAAAVRVYIRDSFAIEARVVAEIEAGTISTVEQIDAAFA